MIAGVSQIPRLFSLSSLPPAIPTASITSGFHVQAKSVEHGNAVVQTPTSGLILTPAGPSAVITEGTPYSGRFPRPNVLATPVLG